MTWAKFCDGFLDHPKVLRAGEDAANLFMRGCIWCNKHLTDGAIPREALRALTNRRDATALAGKLVAVRLWEETADGWQVHDWSDHNPTRDAVEGKRDKTREKVAAWRANRAKTAVSDQCNHGCNRVTCEVCNPTCNPAPDPTRPDPIERPTVSHALAREAPPGDPPSGVGEVASKSTPKAKGPKPKPAPPSDPVPAAGSLARKIYDALVGDRVLAPIVAGPGDFAERIAVADAYPGVNVLAEVLRAGEWAATKPAGHYRDGRAYLRNWLDRCAQKVAGTPRPAGAPPPAPAPPSPTRKPAAFKVGPEFDALRHTLREEQNR